LKVSRAKGNTIRVEVRVLDLRHQYIQRNKVKNE